MSPRFLICACVLLFAACKPLPGEFVCTSTAQCGTAGVCEPNGYCSVPDTGCPSHRIFKAAGAIDGMCVLDAVSDGGVDIGVDGGDGGTTSLCASFTGIACEGFDSVTLSTGWQLYSLNTTVTRDPSRAARGAASGLVHVDAPPLAGRTVAELHRSPFPSVTTFAVRAFYFFPTSPPADFYGRLFSVEQATSSLVTRLGMTNGKLILGNIPSSSSLVSATAMPIGRWACVELVLDLGSPGKVSVYLDGAEVTDLRLTGAGTTMPPITYAAFGPLVDDPGVAYPAYDFWIDELAIDSTRIGCNR